MALLRLPPADPRRFDAGWPTVNRQPFVESQAYLVLKDELARYINAGVRGRSFLIAGHRGAGKTALVRQAAEALHREIFEAAARKSPPRSVSLQRPLLVQLHGPSLVSGKVPGDPEDARKPDLAAVLATLVDRLVPPPPGQDDAAPARGDDVGRGALVQITIALYRAAAAEFADAFALHAQAAGTGYRHRMPDLLELASQLRLDLDMGADAARLRRQWQALGKLNEGVLWPASISNVGPRDQGMREIVALATAAQAFQVCAGKVDQEAASQQNASRDNSVQAKGESSLKEIGGTILALASGLGIGVGTWGTAGHWQAALLGVLAALGGRAVLSWAGRRAEHNEQVATYRFLPDRSVQTLDRELPMVIRRLRDVGLAPVFVIDELDKIDPATIQGDMARLIDRLKLLLTDHGFFCFLADRQYYDAVRQEIETNPYSVSHTYFNDRLFVDYTPPQLAAYVRHIVTIGGAPDDGDALAQAVLARQILLRSRLNFIDLGRAISGLWAADGSVAAPSAQICSRSEYQLPAVVQMAIEHVLRGDTIQLRIARDPAFGQLALDALYMIPRLWRGGRSTLLVRRADIAAYLLGCLGAPDADTATAEALLMQRVGSTDLDVLAGGIAELARLLANFDALKAALAADRLLPEEDKPLRAMLETMPGTGLLELADELEYRFRLDQYGIDLDISRLTRPGAEISPSLADEIKDLSEYGDALDGPTSAASVDSEALIRARALPDTLVSAEILLAMTRLTTAQFTYAAMGSDLLLLRGLRDVFRRRSTELALILQVVIAVRLACLRHGLTPTDILGAMQRNLGAAWQCIGSESAPLERAVRGMFAARDGETLVVEGLGLATTGQIAAWMKATEPVRTKLASLTAAKTSIPPPAQMQIAAWARWAERLEAWLLPAPALPDPPVDLEDLVLAAAGESPGTLFRLPFDQMDALAWGALVLEGATTFTASPGMSAAVRTPVWAVIAGLRALRFDGALLSRLAASLGDATAARFARDAPPAEPGVLIVLSNPALAGALANADIPLLTMLESDGTRYDAALDWLEANGVVSLSEALEDER